MNTPITRRQFLERSLTFAGVTIAVTATPLGWRASRADGLEPPEVAFSPNVWVEIRPDNSVTIIVNKSEMGQGVSTALPMIAADELDADWKLVSFREAPADPKYGDPGWGGSMLTGGSTSVRHMYEPLRLAGAAGRAVLLAAAARAWDVPAAECSAAGSKVTHQKSGRAFTYGELAAKAAGLPAPPSPPLKPVSRFALMGQPIDRLDIPAKVQGKAEFGIDVRVPDMLYASVARPPAFGAKALSYDEKAALAVPGAVKVAPVSHGIAVCAHKPDAAWKARDALQVKWGPGERPDMDTAAVEKEMLDGLKSGGVVAKSVGDAKAAVAGAARTVEATYVMPYLAHVTMEPMNCTASVRADGCDIWAPTQGQTPALAVAQKITAFDPGRIAIHTTFLGGGFGRRAFTDFIEDAVEASKAAGKPVKLLWTREEDIQHDFYRPGNAAAVQAGLDAAGRVVAWSQRIACPSVFLGFMPQAVKNGIDPQAVEGIADMDYAIPNLLVEYVMIQNPIPVGFWRSVGNSENGFTKESFVDELAGAAKKDPLEFRLALLKDQPAAVRVLETAAERAGWGKPAAGSDGRGLAYHSSFGTRVAQVADISVDVKDGTIRVHRVVCALDCGPCINPAIISANVTGAIIMGLSAALGEKIEFGRGGTATANFYDYKELRLDQAPEVEVHILKSEGTLGGIGEPGLPPIAPAVANALQRATGRRIRRLPLDPVTVLQAIRKT